MSVSAASSAAPAPRSFDPAGIIALALVAVLLGTEIGFVGLAIDRIVEGSFAFGNAGLAVLRGGLALASLALFAVCLRAMAIPAHWSDGETG